MVQQNQVIFGGKTENGKKLVEPREFQKFSIEVFCTIYSEAKIQFKKKCVNSTE